jgi:dihydrofolate synthase/folylpolyglutamate synthase
VTGRLAPEVAELARRTADEHGARLVVAPEEPPAGLRVRAGDAYQRRNFALASAAAEAYLERPLDSDAVEGVASSLVVPGRLELLEGEPPTLLDAAHNPDGAAALAEALPRLAAGRPVIACLAVLADKDAAGIAAALAPACAAVVCTELPAAALRGSGRPEVESLGAARLAGLVEAAGASAEAVAEPGEALARARTLAHEQGGLLVVTGSHYLLGQVKG